MHDMNKFNTYGACMTISQDNIGNKYNNFMDIFYEVTEGYLYLINGIYLFSKIGRIQYNHDLRDIISKLKLIITYLNNNEISWTGHKIAFRDGDNVEFMEINSEYIILSYIKDDILIETEYIPLINSTKLS